MTKQYEIVLSMSLAGEPLKAMAAATGLTKRRIAQIRGELKARRGHSFSEVPHRDRETGSRRNTRPIIPHPIDPSIALVELTQGFFATISIVDADAVGGSNWWTVRPKDGRWTYARSFRTDRDGVGRRISLHQFIGARMGLSLDEEVDHENGNGLDCRRSNLRDATNPQNGWNRKRQRNNTSGVKGVSWASASGKWRAQIVAEKRTISVGLFDSIEDATAAIAKVRAEVHGQFANHGAN